MLKIRLKRVGRRNNPSFRVVLVESQKGPQTGKVNENLGSYDPKTNTKEIKADRVKYWIDNGAQVSDTVHNILVSEKIIEGKKINVLPRKSPVVKEEKEVKVETEAETSNESKEGAESEKPSSEEEAPVEEASTEESTSEPQQEEESKEVPEEKPVEFEPEAKKEEVSKEVQETAKEE